MELTRRDVVVALGAAGVTVGGVVALDRVQTGESDGPLDDPTVATFVGAAEVLYPSEVEGIDAFVDRYLGTLGEHRADHAAGIADAATYLDDYSRAWHDERYAVLDSDTRDRVLDRMGVDVADPVPEGTDTERVRYYVVNELLFALYSSPTGGDLVGIENPQGHPGGLASYQRGPRS